MLRRFARMVSWLWSVVTGVPPARPNWEAQDDATNSFEGASGDVRSPGIPLSDLPDAALQALQTMEERVAQLGSIQQRARRLQQLLTATDSLETLPLADDLTLNVRTLKHIFHESSDWVLRLFRISGGRDAALTYFDGLVNGESLDNSVTRPLQYGGFPVQSSTNESLVHSIVENHVINLSQLKRANTVSDVLDAILHGDAALLIDGESTCLILGVSSRPHRSIDEPSAEKVIRGPREGFIEDLRTNTALLRSRLRSPQLKLDSIRVGRFDKKDITIAYLRGLAPDKLVYEVKRRLARIDIDYVTDGAAIEELIEDDPYSPFPQVLNTERPDVVAASLVEGRVAVLIDGAPTALIVPTTLWALLQAASDYYSRYYIASFLRLLRYLMASLALLGPSLYIAIITFHQEMIPTPLLLTVAATREGIPFPAIVEALLMEIAFEALREAGLRLPKQIGEAVSIVGALVIGQAAVQAGIVSAPVVIIVAGTGIASFVFPHFDLGISVRLLRFPMMILAATLGLYGVMIGLLLILVHLSGLRSFGVPYLSPLVPMDLEDLRDVIIRAPVWLRGDRPEDVGYLNMQRQAEPSRPGPEPWEGPASKQRRGDEL